VLFVGISEITDDGVELGIKDGTTMIAGSTEGDKLGRELALAVGFGLKFGTVGSQSPLSYPHASVL